MNQDPTKIAIKTDPLTERMSGIATHGNTPFDVPYISQIDGNLWQGGCAMGLVLPKEFDHVVSLYPWEYYRTQKDVDTYLIVKMYDSLDQAFDQVKEIARWVNACKKKGPVLVHCQAGLNRSSLVVAYSLMLEGMSAKDAIALIREKRSPACLCNPAFEEFLYEEEKKLRA